MTGTAEFAYSGNDVSTARPEGRRKAHARPCPESWAAYDRPVAHRLISRLLVIALLFQAIAIVPAALAYCPGNEAPAAGATHHDCAGDEDAPRHICPGCLAGVSHGTCASACTAIAIPVDSTLHGVAPESASIASLAALPVHGQRDAPPDPPPIG